MYTLSTGAHADKQHVQNVKNEAMLSHLLHPLPQRNPMTEGREDAEYLQL